MDLRVGRVLLEALEELRDNGRVLLLALSAPAIAIAVLNVVFQTRPPGLVAGLLFFGIGTFLYSLFAVTCHRIILLGSDRLPNPYGVYASGEVWRYVGAVVGFCFIGAMAGMLLFPFVAPIMTLFEPDTGRLVAGLLVIVMLLAIVLVSSRIVLLFPSLAVGDGRTLPDILDLSKPTWPRLALLIVASAVVTGLLSWPLDAMTQSAGPTALAAVPAFVSCLIGAYGVAVISCAYRAHVESPGSDQGDVAEA